MSITGFAEDDRRLRTDGFVIRAQATIGTEGFAVRAGFGRTCALRAPTSFRARIRAIHTRNELLQKNAVSRPSICPSVSVEMGF